MSFSGRRRVGAGVMQDEIEGSDPPGSRRGDREVAAGSADRAGTRTPDEGADGHGSSPVTIQQLAATRLVVNETSRSNCRRMRNEMLRIDATREIGAFDRRSSHLDYLTRWKARAVACDKKLPSSRPEPSPSTSLGAGYARRSGGTCSVASATRRDPSATPPFGRLRSG